MQDVDVRDHGATGDGAAKDTIALQAAIDACAAAGGGRVVVPAGRYLTGTLYLRDQVDLHLMPGSRLVASPDREDYNPEDVFPENEAFNEKVAVTGAHLIIAYRVEGASISGRGVIDGNSAAFLDYAEADREVGYESRPRLFAVREWRPGQLVFFCRSTRIAVSGVDILDTPYWGLFLLGCTDVSITGLRIVNPPGTPNGDGIDVDCCRNVTISDCIIRSGDDAITVRANHRRLGENTQPSENIVVTNCVLTSSCFAIRVGVGGGVIRNAMFSNLVITDTRSAINLVCRYNRDGGPRPDLSPGCSISEVTFTSMVIDCIVPFTITAGEGSEAPADVHDITFSHLQVRGSAGSHVAGSDGVVVRRVRFTDIDLRLSGGTENTSLVGNLPELPSVNGYIGRFAFGEPHRPALPVALYALRTEDLQISDVRVHWGEMSPVWRGAFALTRSERATIQDCELTSPVAGEPPLLIDRVDRITLRRCAADSGLADLIGWGSEPGETEVRLIASDIS